MMSQTQTPAVVVLAGPNGAGKSTAAPVLLHETAKVTEFVNADVIAQGLSGFEPERASITAGKIMLTRLHELAEQQLSFAFETTLASRSFAPWIKALIEQGYLFYLIYLWLPSADIAVKRVKARVRLGGHNVPEETIRRRYEGGLRNFFELYRPLAAKWRIYNNGPRSGTKLIAEGQREDTDFIGNRTIWQMLVRKYNNEA